MNDQKKIPPSDEDIFRFMEMFNHLVIVDSEFASRLPDQEFELAFDSAGEIYVDEKPLGVNVKSRYESVLVR